MVVIISGALIILLVLVLSLLTISKGYSYKHKVDPIENNEFIEEKKIN